MAVDCQKFVSVVIVNYNGGRLVAEAVQAVLRSTVPVQVLVCDNGSTDGSLSALRYLARFELRLKLIELERNLGFTRATNVALRQTSGEFLLLLNPDCMVHPDTLERMLKVLDGHPQAGMAGCLIRNPDGSEQVGCRRAVPTPWRSLVRVLHLNKLKPHHPRFQTFLLNREPLPRGPVPVESISGAFMLVRRQALEQVGLLDEGYFLHCDDLDWCMRFRRAGWQVLFVPEVEVVHFKGGCSGGRTLFVEWHKHKGMVRFYRKFFRHQYPLPLMGLVIAAVWARFAVIAGATVFRRAVGASERHDIPVQYSSHTGSAAYEPEVAEQAERVANAAEISESYDSRVVQAVHTASDNMEYLRRASGSR